MDPSDVGGTADSFSAIRRMSDQPLLQIKHDVALNLTITKIILLLLLIIIPIIIIIIPIIIIIIPIIIIVLPIIIIIIIYLISKVPDQYIQ